MLYSNLVANSYRSGSEPRSGIGPWLILAVCVTLPVWLAVSVMALQILGVWSY